MIKIYGIKNCNSIKKTLNWFEQNNIEYTFHDYKKLGAEKETLNNFVNYFGWEIVLNRKGTSWRKLDERQKGTINNNETAIKLMIENNSIIKRPIIDYEQGFLIGYNEAELEKAFILNK
ncbi:MAG: ArsC family reductase [Rickettsiales bacterium]|jgi:arsenate reductase (glutaredoxin)|nr:ArsC family reductase [Rickettsiales bacterium]